MEKNKKDVLILIQSTDATIEGFIDKGLWERQFNTLTYYANDFDVHYYTSDIKSFQERLPKSFTHRCIWLPFNVFGLRHLVFYMKLILYAFKWRFYKDAVVRIFGVTIPVVILVRLISGKRIVTSFQYDWAAVTKKNYKGLKVWVSGFVQRQALVASDCVICTMNWIKEKAINKYKKKNVFLIPNYVDITLFKPSEVKKKQIVFAGRLHWSKGVDKLIKAFLLFKNEYKDYKLIILGDGEEKDNLIKLSSNEKDILFLGNVTFTDVAKIFNDSEIFVLPSQTMEGHPKALIEAMASGCKCIASNVPGNRDVLQESSCSDLIFTTDDVNDLYEKLKYCLSLNDDRQLKFAVKNYDSTMLMGKELEILKDNVRK